MTAADQDKPMGVGKQVLLYALLALLGLVFLLPFFWMVSSSLKAPEEIFAPTPQWIPKEIKWSNYYDAMTVMPFGRFIRNSLVVAASVVVGNLLSASLVAYGFAYFRFPLRGPLFILLLATMMLPGQVTMIPIFKLFSYLGWIDTYKPLIVPAFCGPAFFVFLYRQFFLALPRDLFEAAKVDGCSPLRIYWSIVLPLAKPVSITVAIFSFMGAWNDFMGPLIYLTTESKFTLALGLAQFSGQYVSEWHLLMAASVVAVLPCIVLFFVFQRYFIRGIATTGMKG